MASLPPAPYASPRPSASYHPSTGPSSPSHQTRQTTNPNDYAVAEPLYEEPNTNDQNQILFRDYIGVPTRPGSDHTLSQTIDIRAPIAQLAAISRSPAQTPLESSAWRMEPEWHLQTSPR